MISGNYIQCYPTRMLEGYKRMAKRKKTTNKDKWYSEETKNSKRRIQMRLVEAAEAHKLAATLCASDCRPYDYDIVSLRIVSFELTLVSVEQSLRALSLFFFPAFPRKLKHKLYPLYERLRDEGPGKEWLRTKITPRIDDCAKSEKISPISDEELEECLKKHSSSYSIIKYFRVKGKGGQLFEDPKFSERERLVLYCFAVALIKLNKDMRIKKDFDEVLSTIEQETQKN